jgi:hypothetical protein
MPKEKEITTKVIKLVKSGDKLVRDIEKGVGGIVADAASLKETITKIKDTLQKPEED